MAIKKSDLYSSIWKSCDELRGGMDATQYKDYVLFMLFIKYISDKFRDDYQGVNIPEGARFKDMVALKGRHDIGDKINTQIIQPLIEANDSLARSDFPDFNDDNKLGQGPEKVQRLTNLIAIFENPALDFSQNQAEHDDILGDAYEYLIRHFATQSGKSKGQFYTPAEVSRVIAKVIGISPTNTLVSTTAYDPTCGSGSLLLRLAAEAGKEITLEGQEKDITTAGLARLNMILHGFPTANIQSGNTLTTPKFKDGANLRTYDYVVANPPFSDKGWTNGLNLERDPYERFGWGVPPAKQGDYAYLLHIIRSIKSTGKGACILPHGVLFRGGTEALIRQRLIQSGYLKGIIGLPANLFYGTGIPACILVLDKADAHSRQGIFMIDASRGYIKDDKKNRLREQDIHKIVDTFHRALEVPRYSRMVPLSEIADPKNDYNLNLPRYIDTSEPEDLQDIDAHLRGGIPQRDIEALQNYWQVMPGVREALFESAGRPGYVRLRLPAMELKGAILNHPEFQSYVRSVQVLYEGWKARHRDQLWGFDQGNHPKALIAQLSEDLLVTFRGAHLVDPYDVYQHLMDYWNQGMQDDAYLIAADGWVESALPREIPKADKSEESDYEFNKRRYKSDLLPSTLLIEAYFAPQQQNLQDLEGLLTATEQRMEEMLEEHGGESGLLSEVLDGNPPKVNTKNLKSRLVAIANNPEEAEEAVVLKEYQGLLDEQSSIKTKIKTATNALLQQLHSKYAQLGEEEIKALIVDHKWLAAIDKAVQKEINRVSQTLSSRLRLLAERYGTPLPALLEEVEELAARVDEHLRKMGAVWE